MPAVTVFSKPNGEPIATTHSPDPADVRVAEAHDRQPVRLDLEQRDVGAAVGADHLRLELALVGQLHRDLVRRLDDVRVGQDVAVGADDEARAERLRLELARPGIGHEAPEEFVERIVFREIRDLRQQRIAHRLRGADVDDGRALLLDQIGEIGQLRGRPRARTRKPEQQERRTRFSMKSSGRTSIDLVPACRWCGYYLAAAAAPLNSRELAICMTVAAGASPSAVTM